MIGTVYILTTRKHTVLYTGVTSDLSERLLQHQKRKYPNSFTARYNVDKLVYFKEYPSMIAAIKEEKRIKSGSRKAKIKLIEGINPDWKNLSERLQ